MDNELTRLSTRTASLRISERVSQRQDSASAEDAPGGHEKGPAKGSHTRYAEGAESGRQTAGVGLSA